LPEHVAADGAVDVLLRRAEEARVGSRRVVLLIDGRSGSGKTTLGRAVAAAWPVERLGAVRLVHLDDVYPGWHGLAAASRAVETTILSPVEPGWRRWDWQNDRAGEWEALDPAVSLIVEGAGAVTRASSAVADVRVWLELDAGARRARALARDGATYEPWWDVWSDQEEAHLARDEPRSLADVLVDA
jgi:uridine kinase